ncbi:MAG TPA: hypothetical protein VGK77_11840 [Candidatus Binatia bacterium]|jgi:hypothetical protein
MNGLERSKSKIRQFFPASLRRGESGVSLSAAVVQLIDSPRRLPATPIEQRLSSALREAGPISLASLVKRVAAELYSDELRQGAAVLDIGLIGDRLFNRDIVRELTAGNGILWEIKQQRKSL